MKTRIDQKPATAVLLVEDDEVILELQASVIAARFPEVMLYTAANGRAGLELFKTHTPDIVITDINMAEMCGLQMSDNIRAIKPDTKIIAITGKTSEPVEKGKFILKDPAGKNIEFHHFIIKPVVLSELFAVVDQCIAELGQPSS